MIPGLKANQSWQTVHKSRTKENISNHCNAMVVSCDRIKLVWRYTFVSLSWSPRDSLKYFENSVLRHIRFAELRKTINRTTTLNKWICNLTPEVKRYIEYTWIYLAWTITCTQILIYGLLTIFQSSMFPSHYNSSTWFHSYKQCYTSFLFSKRWSQCQTETTKYINKTT